MNSTHSITPCENFRGDEKLYQAAAADAVAGTGRDVMPWSWITPTCGNLLCVEPEHLIVQRPVTLAYPYGICIYCGGPGWTKDHLLPRHWTGDAKRHYVVTVPACGPCNSRLGDTLTWSITERRAICHERIKRKYRKVLRSQDFTPEELDEFGRTLRNFVEEEAAKKAAVRAMLAWPTDPHYDLRALEKSGIENPYAVGLILPDDVDLDEYVRSVA